MKKIFSKALVLAALILSATAAQAQDYKLTTIDLPVAVGKTAKLPINLTNVDDVYGVQFEIELPEGLIASPSIAAAERTKMTYTDDFGDEQDGFWSWKGNNVGTQLWRYVGNFNAAQCPATKETSGGTIATVSIKDNANTEGVYEGKLKSVIFSTTAKKVRVDDKEGVTFKVYVVSADGISGVGADAEDSNAAMYDLSGRKLEKAPANGVYIKNGKKYVK